MPRLPAVKRFVSNTGVQIYRIPCEVLPNLTGRVYLLLGAGPPTLVDAGSGEGNSTQQILQGLESVGNEFGEKVALRDVKRILITHAHIDHFGGLPQLVERTKAEVAVHRLDQRVIAAYDERVVVAKHAMQCFLKRAGVAAKEQSKVLAAFGYARGRVRSVPVNFPFDDGQQFDGLQCVHTPGHSPGHVCIAAGDVLLAGDHILARTIPQQWPESIAPYTGLGHYLDSLEKIRRRNGVALILGGHEPPVRNVLERIDEIRSTHLRRLDRLLDILRKAPHPLSIEEITEQMYSRQKGFYALLALTDVGSRMEYLDQRGQLAIANFDEVERESSPVYRYQPA